MGTAPALDCMLGCTVDDLDKDDMCKGLGYYHFCRVSAGTMSNGPNFNLADTESVMFFIDPEVLSTHHFIVCRGDAAKLTAKQCPGKLHSLMSQQEALHEALRAIELLSCMVQQGLGRVPFNNEIAVFRCVESTFFFRHVAALDGSSVLTNKSPYCERAFKVFPTTERHKASKEAVRRSFKEPLSA